MTSGEENNGNMSSSETRSPLVAKDDEKLGDDGVVLPIGEQEEPLERNSASDNDSEEETAVNPLSSDAAQMLQNLLLSSEIQRERLVGLIQLCDPAAQEGNAIMNAEGEQMAREADLSSQVHFLEQSVQKLQEEVENQKKLNAQLEEEIKRLAESSDP